MIKVAMNILILSNEVWNDKINGNNVTTNWFEGMEAEFANIYASPGEPCNSCCQKYFQITDKMMIKSIFSRKRAGRSLDINILRNNPAICNVAEEEPEKLYGFLKRISGDFLRFVRELIWLWGRYDIQKMKQFIDEFQPDIIFTERMASCKMLRLEKLVSELTDAPFIAFTGDDEYSLRQFKFSPFFWINRFMVRKRLREMVKKYKIYYTLSLEQKNDYEKRFGCQCKILQKCGEFENGFEQRQVHKPIKLIYAGKFYCNRWKVLGEIVEVLKEINESGVKMILEIYTRDIPNRKQKKLLDDRRNSFIMGGVSQEELCEIYQNADIAVHVEAQDIKNRLATRLSFSTKIIDCLFSGCAVLAYCWNQHSGWTYLKRENTAICISSADELKRELKEICNRPELIQEYAVNAYECGMRNHQRKKVQEGLMEDFKYVISENI